MTIAPQPAAPSQPSRERTLIDPVSTLTEYLDRSDWRVNANANQDYSVGGLILNSAGKMIANYWLDEIFSPEAGHAHREGDIHIHDLDMLTGYCAGWSLRALLEEGFNGVIGAISSQPPRHFSSACRSEEHTSELQSRGHLVCRLLLEKNNISLHRII